MFVFKSNWEETSAMINPDEWIGHQTTCVFVDDSYWERRVVVSRLRAFLLFSKATLMSKTRVERKLCVFMKVLALLVNQRVSVDHESCTWQIVRYGRETAVLTQNSQENDKIQRVFWSKISTKAVWLRQIELHEHFHYHFHYPELIYFLWMLLI